MARDAGLARISAVTRWVTAGVVGLAGALAVLAAQAFHGHTVSNSSSATPSPVTQSAAPTSSQSDLQQPSQAPVQTPAAPVVVSGGS
jgi:membrane protein required for beta-lactamase induction